MMPHDYNELTDFLLDDRFTDWVKTGHNSTYWGDFFSQHPEKRILAEQARALIQAAAGLPVVQPHADQVSQMWTQIEAAVQEPVVRPLRRLPTWTYWAAAASVVAVLIVGGRLWFQQRQPQTVTYQQLVSQSEQALREVNNQTNQPQLVRLADGSTVRVDPGSRLSFPPTFRQAAQREVYLSGQAFFDIAKNPQQPFLVHTNELVTKVLGTSFTIRADEKASQITVEVKTGKVWVFRQSDPEGAPQAPFGAKDGVVLKPNQQATFDRTNGQLAPSLVTQPKLLVEPSAIPSFEYDETPAPLIFNALEKAYGVDIVYDKALLADCRLTASLTDESLFDKIRLVCQSLDAQYEIIGTQIVISAKGCANDTNSSPNP
ncbi:FecR family protein [Spirosoma soli]|uniref:FecR family protein n=1 Tax=Spirosoma soli TaxID=1770529 RepID=A0ABW5M6R2_9BACT